MIGHVSPYNLLFRMQRWRDDAGISFQYIVIDEFSDGRSFFDAIFQFRSFCCDIVFFFESIVVFDDAILEEMFSRRSLLQFVINCRDCRLEFELLLPSLNVECDVPSS